MSCEMLFIEGVRDISFAKVRGGTIAVYFLAALKRFLVLLVTHCARSVSSSWVKAAIFPS